MHLHGGLCVTECPVSTYEADNNTCEPCASLCLECVATNCIQCRPAYFLDADGLC